jgi:hypothetical protein
MDEKEGIWILTLEMVTSGNCLKVVGYQYLHGYHTASLYGNQQTLTSYLVHNEGSQGSRRVPSLLL